MLSSKKQKKFKKCRTSWSGSSIGCDELDIFFFFFSFRLHLSWVTTANHSSPSNPLICIFFRLPLDLLGWHFQPYHPSTDIFTTSPLFILLYLLHFGIGQHKAVTLIVKEAHRMKVVWSGLTDSTSPQKCFEQSLRGKLLFCILLLACHVH